MESAKPHLVLTGIGFCLCLLLSACSSTGASRNESPLPSEVLPEPAAKNVILFIGDGMGVATVTAARIFDGQSRGLSGEEHVLPFETFPNVALVKTYNTNQQVPDSAGTITAMLTGTKTRAGLINVGPDALRRSCKGQLANPLTPITTTLRDEGKAIARAEAMTAQGHAVRGVPPTRCWHDHRKHAGPGVRGAAHEPDRSGA